MYQFTIKESEAGQRFNKYLQKLLPAATSSFLYKMLRKKNIELNSKKAAGNEVLKSGDTVKLFFQFFYILLLTADIYTVSLPCRDIHICFRSFRL